MASSFYHVVLRLSFLQVILEDNQNHSNHRNHHHLLSELYEHALFLFEQLRIADLMFLVFLQLNLHFTAEDFTLLAIRLHYLGFKDSL